MIESQDRPADSVARGDHEEEEPRPGSDSESMDEEATEDVTTDPDLLNPKKRVPPSVSDVYPEPDDEETSRELDLVI